MVSRRLVFLEKIGVSDGDECPCQRVCNVNRTLNVESSKLR